MSYQYVRNDESAKKVGGTPKINETGAYVGIITRAEHVVSQNSVVGVEIDFKCDDGRTAQFLRLNTVAADGKDLSGARIVDGLMTVFRLKTMECTTAQIDKWDKDTKGQTKQRAEIFADLMNKPVGLVLQKEHDVYKGEPTEKMNIYACFEPGTNKTPKELLDRQPASALEPLVANLKDYHKKEKGGSTAPAHQGSRPAPQSNFSDLDDDIPF